MRKIRNGYKPAKASGRAQAQVSLNCNLFGWKAVARALDERQESRGQNWRGAAKVTPFAADPLEVLR